MREALALLRSKRGLIFSMVRREIWSRHAGQLLGPFWTVAQPLFQMVLMVFIFGVVFRQRIGGTYELPYDYTVYILCGLSAWLSLSPSLTASMGSVTSNANLVKQFNFDARILPVKDVVISSVVWGVSLSVVMLYTLFVYQSVPWTYVLIPIVAVVHFMTALGCAWALSALSVFLRDLREIVALIVMAMIYLLPIVYLPNWIPEIFHPIVYLNPFSHLIWIYQDVFYFGRIEHPVSWILAAFFALVCFSLGYRLFKRLQTMFGRVL
jgi:lipopolysaccharide transport system permease protein